LTALATSAAQIGDAAAAERYATEGLTHAGPADAPDRAQLHHLRAVAVHRQGGREREVVDDALRAAHLLDQSDPVGAVRDRLLAAEAFHRDGRLAEAVGLLEAVRPDAEHYASPQRLVWLDRTLATCLAGLDEPRDAAESLARAALIAAGWEDQHTHASIAHESGDMLHRAGLIGPAEQAYARAAELWADLGERATRVRAVRAGAWLRIRRAEPDWPPALAMLESAARLADDERGDAELAYERLETTLQIGQLLAQWPAGEDRPADGTPRALAAAEEAAAGLADLHFAQAVRAHLVAAQIESQLMDRADAAIARLERVRDQSVERGDTESAHACERRLTQLARRRPNQ
jgi:hypothetical protein